MRLKSLLLVFLCAVPSWGLTYNNRADSTVFAAGQYLIQNGKTEMDTLTVSGPATFDSASVTGKAAIDSASINILYGGFTTAAGVHIVVSDGSSASIARAVIDTASLDSVAFTRALTAPRAIVDTAVVGQLSSVFSANSSADNLTVRNDSDAGISVLTPATKSGWLMFGDPGATNAGFVRYDHATDNLEIGSGGNSVIYVSSAGGVGLGNPPANYGLRIDDNYAGFPLAIFNQGNNANRQGIFVQAGAADGSGNTKYLYACDGSGDEVGYIWNTSGTFQLVDISDRRVKSDIVDARLDARSIVRALRVRKFSESNTPGQIGFIAQEVARVYPAASVGDSTAVDSTRLDSMGAPMPVMMGIAKSEFIPLLVRAVQDQQAQIDSLWLQILDLDSRLKKLEQ